MSQENQKQPARRKRRRRRGGTGRAFGLALLYIVFVIGLSVLLAAMGWISANDVLALNKPELTATVVLGEDLFITAQEESEDGGTKTVYTADMSRVGDILVEEGLVDYKPLFLLFSKFTGSETKLRPGAYTLNSDMDFRALIAGMGSNSTSRMVIKVTIPEGYTVEQTFRLLEEKGVSSADELMDFATNYNYKFSFLQDIPLGDPNRLEGFLFPDTYEFYVNHDPKYVINKLLQNFDAHYPEELRTQVANGDYTLREMLTIASLIERETDGSDRSHIASVIYNRLENPTASAGTNGFLQIDAALYYITGHSPTELDKKIDSPYNTYLYPGLPPTPIASPGAASIRAAFNPDKTDDYYYALGDDGIHHFFKTFSAMSNWMRTQELYK